jgi:hypothetical protein
VGVDIEVAHLNLRRSFGPLRVDVILPCLSRSDYQRKDRAQTGAQTEKRCEQQDKAAAFVQTLELAFARHL